jgi:ABC-type glycerol-3-phosphate transport system permease component
MGGVFITLVPTLILVIVVWNFVVEGILFGGSKY